MPKGYEWAFAGPPKKPLTPALKKQIEEACTVRIDRSREKCVQPRNPDFGYSIDIYGKWYRYFFYFIQRIKLDQPGFEREVEFKFTRLECFAGLTCNLAYMRHTGQWGEVFQGLSLEDCMKEILSSPVCHPG